MGLPLAQIFCGKPPSIAPSHALPFGQPTTDDSFILRLIQPRNPPRRNAEAPQARPGTSSDWSLPLQHQAQCLQAIQKTIRQFDQHLKTEQQDRKTLQLIVLQLQNDFTLLRYLSVSSVGTIPICHPAVKNSATSPLLNSNPNVTLNVLLLHCSDGPQLRRYTPEDTVGPPRAKPNKFANVDLQSSTTTREASPTTAQNLTSRISKLE